MRVTNRTTRSSPPRLAAPRMFSRLPRRGRDPIWRCATPSDGFSGSGSTSSSLPSTRERRRATRRSRRLPREQGSATSRAVIRAWWQPSFATARLATRSSLRGKTARRSRVRRPGRWPCVQTHWCVNRSQGTRNVARFRASAWYQGRPCSRITTPLARSGIRPRAKPCLAAVLIGVDERTCALWEAGVWRCVGAGAVTVYSPGGDAVRVESGNRRGDSATVDGGLTTAVARARS